MSRVVFDMRDALRVLRRSPAYALTVVLTPALTIGATTAVFSIANGVLMRPLRYTLSLLLPCHADAAR